jgi:predicted  nucleic acid-binding Zn-ribbon protein
MTPNISIRCDKCSKNFVYPFPSSVLYQATCPDCGEKNLRYVGNDPTVQKMLLAHYGVTKDMEEEITNLKTQIGALQSRLDSAIADSKDIMTTALLNAVEETIEKHVKEYHGYSVPK